MVLSRRHPLANTPDPGVHLSTRGFNATFFKYELGSDMGWRPGYFKHISKSSLGLETVGKVVDMNFRFEPQAENPNFHNVYRSKQRVTNMGLRLTAYFRPHASGYYRFNLAANDGAQLTIGPIRWPCEHKEKIETHKLVALRALKDQSHLSVNEFDVHLIEGYYYPVEVITFNLQGDASLQLSVTDPEIINYADFGYLVHQGTFDKCGTSSKALSNSVFADANKPAEDSQTHSQAAPPPMLHEFSSVHGMGYEDSSLIKDRSGQRSFDSTDSVVNAQIGNTEHLKSEDLMVLGRPIIEAEYFDSWGFNIDEYKYSVGGKQGWEQDYFTSPRTGEKTQSLKNIDSINYDSEHPENRKYSSRYGSRPKSTGFEAEMSAHFKAPTSGTYSFELTGDDGAYMSIGLAEIPCGRRGRGFRSIFEMTALTKAPRYNAFQKTGPVTSRGLVTLLRDMYYPVKVITFNLRDSYSLQLSVTDPLGLKIPDFGNLVFQARDECGPLGKAMSNSLMGAYDTSADTQNGYTTRHSVHSENLHMPDNSTARLYMAFSTLKKNLPDTEYVIVQGGPVDNGIHVHLLNTTDKSPKEPDQLSVKLPGIIETQESGPDPLSPSELAASGDIEDKEKPLRQFRDTTDPKKQTKPQPMLKQDESTQVSVGPQALSDFKNSTALQVLSKLVEQGAPDKNDTSSGVVDKLPESVTRKNNETKPDAVEKSSTEPTSDAPKKNQSQPDVHQGSSKVKGPKDSKNNETEPGVGRKSPTSAMTKNNETKPGVVGNLLNAVTPKNNETKLGGVEESSKERKLDDSTKSQPSPAALQLSSTVMGQKVPENNGTKPSVVEKPLEAVTSRKNDTKPDALQLSSTVLGQKVPENNGTKPSVVEKPLEGATSKNDDSKPDVLQAPSTVVDKKLSNNNETEAGALEEPSKAATSKNNETQTGVAEKPSKKLTSMNSDTNSGLVAESRKEPTSENRDTKPDLVEKSSKEPTADVFETRDPRLEVAKELSQVETSDILKNDRKSSNFVNQKGVEEDDPKRESSGEPSEAVKGEDSNETDADSVVSKNSSKIVPDDSENANVTGEIFQGSLKELKPDSVTDYNSTPDVLGVTFKELEPHDQKLNELVVNLIPLLKEGQTLDVPKPGVFEAPLVLVSGNLTAATPIVDTPADSNNSISNEVKASPPFALGVLLRVDPAGLNLTMIPEVESADTPVIAKENISANSGSEIPVPKEFEVSASLDSTEPAFSNISMPAQSVVQMPVPSEIIAESVPENETSADLNEQVPADPEDPMPDSLEELMPETLLAEALVVSDAPLSIAPEDTLKDTPIEISTGIANVSSAYRSEEALPSLLNDSGAEISNGLRPAVPEVPLLAASQNLSPVFANLENFLMANETLPVLTSLENSVIANKTLSVVAIDEVSETPASEAPIVSIAKVSESKSGASEDPLSLIAVDEPMYDPTRFQEANPESVKQMLRGTNSTATSHLAHGTQVEALPKESELVPDELGTLEVVSDKRLQETKPLVQLQERPYSQLSLSGPSDDNTQMNSVHGKTGGVVVHIAQDAEIMAGNPGSSTLNVDSNPQKSTSNSTTESFTRNRKEPSTPRLLEAGTMAPVLACLGNNCSSEAAIGNVNGTPSIKDDGLKAASDNSRMMTLAAVAGCSPFYTTGFGFNAKFYTYDLLSKAGWEPDFFTSGYRTTLTKTVRAVAGANYQTYFLPPSAVDHDFIYGYYTTSTNFAVELSGFFRAPFSGKYTFQLDANAGASFQLGTSGTCCNDAACSDLGDLAINTLGTTDADTNLVSYKLLAGGYYPVKIVLFNSRGNAGLLVAVTDPWGVTLSDMGLQVFQANFRNSQCGPITTGVTTVTSQWKKTYTSTTTNTGKGTNTVVVVAPKPTTTVTTIRSDSKTKTTTICGKLTDTVVVGVPTPTTTLTAVWTGLGTSTTTVAGLTKTVIVEVPKSHVTVTKTWDNSFVQTTTVEGSFTDTVIVDVPTPTTTLTSVWTGSFTSSRTAVGGPGESNTVIVEVPKKTETTTRTWTGLTHSVSTISGLLTDTVVVNVPTPLVTLTSAWSNTYVSTKTISGSTNTIVVEVPKATTTITSTWTGASTVPSTIQGALTDTVIVNVPTPTVTFTSPWSQSYTSTTTALDSTITVIVEVPKATVTSTSTWSNSVSRTSTVPGEFTDTIVVNVPKPTTTITSAWSETYTSTSTHTGATDTVVVDVPKKSVTLTSTWPNSFFLTLTFAGMLTDTIVVNVPKPTTTLTSAWLNTYTSTTTLVGPTNSVIVEVPKAITTVTRTWSDSYTTSSTVTGALTDSVIVDVPKPITTVTSAWTQSFASTTTMTGVTNTIVVEVPKVTATVTNTWTNPFVSSSTISGAFTDTIVVEVPTPTQTVTSVWTGSYVTSTTVTGGPGENNTVIVEVPHSLTTVTRTWTGSRTTTYILSGSVTDTIVVNDPSVQSMSSSLSESYRSVSFSISGSSSETGLLSKVSRSTSLGQDSSSTVGSSSNPGTFASDDVPQRSLSGLGSLTVSTSFAVRLNIESSVIESESPSGPTSLPNSGVLTNSAFPSSELDASSSRFSSISSSSLIEASPSASSKIWSTDAATYSLSQSNPNLSSSYDALSSSTAWAPGFSLLLSGTSSQTRPESSGPAASSLYGSLESASGSVISSMVSLSLMMSGDLTEEISVTSDPASSGTGTFSKSGETQYSHDVLTLSDTTRTSASPVSSTTLATSDAFSSSISLDGSSTGSWKYSADHSSLSRVDSSSAAGSWAMNPSETPVSSSTLGEISSASVLLSSLESLQSWAPSSDFEKLHESDPASLLIVSSGESLTSVDFSTSQEMGSATVSTVTNSSSSSFGTSFGSWEQAISSTEPWSPVSVSSASTPTYSFVSSDLVEPTRVAVSSADLGFTSDTSRSFMNSQLPSITEIPTRSDSEVVSSETVLSSSIADASSDMQSSVFSTTESTTGFTGLTESGKEIGSSFASVHTSATGPFWASSLSSLGSDASFSDQELSITSSRLVSFESRGASTSLEAISHFSGLVTPTSTTGLSSSGPSTNSWSSMLSVSVRSSSTLTDASSVTLPEGGSIGSLSSRASASGSLQLSNQPLISSFVDSMSGYSTGSPTESEFSSTHESTQRSSFVTVSEEPSSFKDGHASASSTLAWSDSTSIFEPTKAVPSSMTSVLPSNFASSSAFASRYWNMSAHSSDFESSRVDASIASETDFTSVHSSSQSESSKAFVVSHSSASSSVVTSLTDLLSSIVSTVAVSSDASEMYASSSASSGVPISSAVSEPSATSSLPGIESSGFSSASEPTIVPTSSSTLEISSSSVILSSYEPLSHAHSEVGTASISASSTIFEYLDSQVTKSMTVSESSKDAFSDTQTSSADMLSGSEVASRSLLGDSLSSQLSSWMISVSGTTSESAPGASFPSTFESGPSSEAISTTIGSSNSFGDLDSTSTELSRLVSEPLPGSSSTLQESVSTGASFVESQSSSSIHSSVRSDTISFTSMTSPEPWHVSSTATETGFTSGDFESNKMSHQSTTKSDSELSEVSTSTHDFTLELSSIRELWSQTVRTSADSVSVGVTFPSNGYESSSTSTFSTSIAGPPTSSGSVTSSAFSDLEVYFSSFEEVPSRLGLWSFSLAASATEGASSYTGNVESSVSGTVSERVSLSASSDVSETTSLSSSSVFSGWNASYETTTKATLSESRPLSLSGDFTSIKSDALSSGSGNTATSVIQTTALWPSGDGSANLTPSGSMSTSLLLTTAHSTSDATLSFSSSEPFGSESSTTIAISLFLPRISLSLSLSSFGTGPSRVEVSPSEESSLYMTSPTASAPGERIVLSSSQISSDHLSEEVSRGSTVTSGGFSSAVISSMASMSPTSTFGSLATSDDISDSSDWLSSGVLPSSGYGSQSSIEMSSAISLSKTWPVTSATSSDWPILLTSGLDDAASRSASTSASVSASVSSSFAESVITSGIWVSGSDSVSATSDSVEVTSGLSDFKSYQPSIESGVFSNTGLNRGSFTFTGPFPPTPSQAMSLGSASSAEATLSEISWQSDAETGSSMDPSSSDAYALPSTSITGPVTSSLGEFISSSMWSSSFVSNSGAHDAESMLSSNLGASSKESGTALTTATFISSSSVGLPSQSADATSSSEPTSYYFSSIESGSSTNTGFMTSNTAVSPDVSHSGTSSALARSSSSQASEGLDPQSSLASEIVSSWELHVSGSLAVSLQASTTELASESDFLAEFTSTPGFPSHTFSSDTDLETFSDSASLGVSSSNLEMSSFTRTKPAPESSYSSVTSFEVGLASTSTAPWAASTSGSSDVSSFGEFSFSSRDVTIVDSASSAKWGSTTQTNSPSHITSSMISSSDELPSITLSSVANLELSSEVSSSEHSTNVFTSTLLSGSLALSENSSAFSAITLSESVTVSSFGPETSSEVLSKSASHVTDGVSISSGQSVESLETESTRTSLPESISSMFSFVPSRIESEPSSLVVSTSLDSSVLSYESESSKELPSSSSDSLGLGHSSVEPGSHSLAATFIVPSSTRLNVYVASSTVIVGPGTSFFSTDSSMHLTSELSLKSLRTSSAVSNSESHSSSESKESSLSSLDVATSLSSLPGSSLKTRLPLYVSSAALSVDSFVTHSSVESAYSTSEYSAHSAILLLSGSSNMPLNYRESSSLSDALTGFTSASENASSASFESSSEIVSSVTSTIADTSFSASAETLSGTMSRSVTDSDAMPETSAMSSQRFTSETYVSQGFHTDPSSVLYSESSVTFEPSIESVSSSESHQVAGSNSLVETGLILMAKPTTSTNAAFTSIDATFVKPWPSSGDDLGSSESVSLTDVTSLAGGSSSSELLQQLGVTPASELLLDSTSFSTISSTSHTWSSGSATVFPTSSSRTVSLLDLSSGSSSVVSSIIDSVASSGLASHVTTVAGLSSLATSDLENASSTFVSAVSSFDAESITRSVSHDPVLASSVISWSSSLTSSISSKQESESSNLAEQSTASNSLPFSGSNLGSSVLSISGTEYVTATLLETNTLYTSIAASFVERGSSSIHSPHTLLRVPS
ncbi:hypothetical protein HF325_001028 [Metschnikowia pulcherrima]|uniref:PA14 domain-containing protein n=1 Tax=Metschnikowia pulcherrima TaxID=27326 RepID=A0A8H7H0H7_9ASCO|nr:hypothetical protein HF325_001028 [Metschnikowia pulcherrima]